jgi:branched-chain amino acid aminotransferase
MGKDVARMLMLDGILREGKEPVLFTDEGVYEVIRTIGGKPLFLKEHFDRFVVSVEKKGFPLPYGEAELRYRIETLLKTCETDQINVRLEYGYLEGAYHDQLYTVQGVYPDAQMKEAGVRLTVGNVSRHTPDIKYIDRAYKDRVADLLEERGAFELLLTDGAGHITEGSRSNFFLIVEGVFIEAPRETMLSGITRRKVIILLEEMGLAHEERVIDDNLLDRASAAFITGTSNDVLPVSAIDGRRYDPHHPSLRRLMRAYEQLKEASLKG